MSAEEQKYLNQLGWGSEEYFVKPGKEVEHLTKIAGWQNYIYSIKDPKGISLFSKSHKIVKKSFWDKHNSSESKEETKVIPLQDEAKPSGPPKPPASPIPPTNEKEVDVVEPETVDPKDETDELTEMEEIILKRAAVLDSKGWKASEDETSFSKDGKSVTIVKIGAMDNAEWIDFLKPVTKESFVCGNEENGQKRCDKICEWCEKAEKNGRTPAEQSNFEKKEQAKEKIKNIVKTSGVPEDKVIVGAAPPLKDKIVNKTKTEEVVPVDKLKEEIEKTNPKTSKGIESANIYIADVSESASKKDSKNTVEEQSKKSDDLDKKRAARQVKKETKISEPAKKEKVKTVKPASQSIVDKINLLEDIGKACATFSDLAFCISDIRDIIESDNTDEKKLILISNAVKNVEE